MPSQLLIKATCFILLSFFNSPTTITADPNPIRDIDGDLVIVGDPYYMNEIDLDAGGGINYRRNIDLFSPCSTFAVTQTPDLRCGFDYDGVPITFSVKTEEEYLTDSIEVGISFVGLPPPVSYGCDKPTMNWKMASHNNQLSVELGMLPFGGLGASDENQSSAFRISKNDAYGYRITYCPNASWFEESACGSLKAVYDRKLRSRRMVIAYDNDPLKVMFVKTHRRRSPHGNKLDQ